MLSRRLGGHLWEYIPATKRCHKTIVKPLQEERVQLRLRYQNRDGSGLDDIAVIKPRPLFHRAAVESHTTEYLSSHGVGGLGTRGSAGSLRYRLY